MRFSRSATKTVTIFLYFFFTQFFVQVLLSVARLYILVFLCVIVEPHIYTCSSHVPSTHAHSRLSHPCLQQFIFSGPKHGLAFNLNFTKEDRQRRAFADLYESSYIQLYTASAMHWIVNHDQKSKRARLTGNGMRREGIERVGVSELYQSRPTLTARFIQLNIARDLAC